MEQFEDQLAACPHCGYIRGTSALEAYHMPPENILRGRYVVGRVLGFGGFGVTYIGWDAQLERKVAIKEFLPTTLATRMPGSTAITIYGGESTAHFEDGLVRFVDEAQRLAKFNGLPGIVDIYDSFSENNTGYIVMQFLEGRDVKEILSAEGSMPYDRALPIILAVTETLEKVHAQGLIHRDIAPDNIYITKDGAVKLLDFGAARYESALNSKSLSVILKPGYAPEEQYRSQGEQGSWTDVYALAATFYKMITGVTPEDSMERSVQDDLKEPSRMGTELPRPAENALMNALNIRADNRTKNMTEFAASFGQEEVVRVKVKQKRKTPVWLIIALVGAVVCLILFFGFRSATGAIQPINLPDGMVNAPGLINRQEDEAIQLAQENGLKYTIAGKDFNEKVEAEIGRAHV
jgi:serine/threonine protein kinase